MVNVAARPAVPASVIRFEQYRSAEEADLQQRIVAARAKLGSRLVILGHHYQNEAVYRHADFTGDSLRLARQAAQSDAEYIVFLGVHFMAEVADILSRPEQTVILPDLAAGCSMADMANLAKVERCRRELAEHYDFDALFTPVTYINSAADLKAFCGAHGGIVCTSSNAGKIAEWAFSRREKVLFFPDQHLGRWTGHKLGIPPEQMQVWDPDLPLGGLTRGQIDAARILLWKGHCSVHQMFRAQDILDFRAAVPHGRVIAHPECCFDVCRLADDVGSTEYILKAVTADSPQGTHWLVGTELNLVNRLAERMRPEGKIVQFMSSIVCECSTMARIDPQHLAWTLESLAQGDTVNRIRVAPREAEPARLALERMLENS